MIWREIILPDYTDFIIFFMLRYRGGVSREWKVYWKATYICRYVISDRDPCFTVIHRLDMSASVNEKPHVNDLPPPPHCKASSFIRWPDCFHSRGRCLALGHFSEALWNKSVSEYLILAPVFPLEDVFISSYGLVASTLLLIQYLDAQLHHCWPSRACFIPSSTKPDRWPRRWTSVVKL